MDTHAQTQKKILIIEDDASIRKILSLRFKKLGFDVIAAADGQEGLQEARRHSPAVIILDLSLPKLSGEEVCKAIREDKNKKFAGIPIIMLTGKASDTDRIIGKVIGANSYLTKPFRSGELLKEVIRFL